MSPNELWRRAKFWLKRDEHSRELEEEMRIHIAMRSERIGTTAAQRRFGNATHLQQESRDVWGFGTLEDLSNDARFAIRRLVQRPAFACAVIAILAIGIGATTAMFSVVDAALLRPLPFRSPDQLVVVPEIVTPKEGNAPTKSLNLNDVRSYTQLFSSVAAYGSGAVNLADPSNPLRVNASAVTPEFFGTLDVAPVRGRVFTQEELLSGNSNVVLLSNGLWRRQYGGRDIAGLTISLNNVSHRVIGVMPEGFSFPGQSDLWVPYSLPGVPGSVRVFRTITEFTILARLVPSQTAKQASQQLFALWQQRLRDRHVKIDEDWISLIDGLRTGGSVVPLRNVLTGDRRTALVVLLGATVLLLMVACGNVSNLLLAHAASRTREIAMRRVLGASRARVVRQLLVESTVLALTGAALGVALAYGSLQFMRVVVPPSLAGVSSATIDARVLWFTIVVALGTGVLFGLWPALGSVERDSNSSIKSAGNRGSTTLGANRWRRSLVAAELALTTTLLIGASLMVRSFNQLIEQNAGLDADGVGTMELSLPASAGGRADRLQRIDAILNRITSVSGVTAAGVVNDLPLSGVSGMLIGIRVDGVEQSPNYPPLRFLQASSGYFDAMRIRLLSGRMFNAADDSLAPQVAIISESVAKRYWPGRSAVGQTFHGPGPSGTFTIVGVVSDLREHRLEDMPGTQLYLPVQSRTPSTFAVVARSSLSAEMLLRQMNNAVRAVDPSQAVFNLRMMTDVVSSSVAPRRVNTILLAAFAMLALLLASVGVYAVVSFSVSNRSRELGIRSALGATGFRLLAMISHEMAWVAVGGIGVGLVGAWVLARTLQGLVYGVAVHDPVSFAVVPLVLLAPTIVATLVPSWRAYRVNPADVMRAD